MTLKMKASKSKNSALEDEEPRVQIFVQQMLMARIFVASFMGRFYVEHLKSYRDAIKIHSSEKDFINDILIVRKRIDNYYKQAVWASITGPAESIPGGHCLWVNLQNVAFGTYWFTIDNVQFSEKGEVEIKVRTIRNAGDKSQPSNTADDKEKLKDIKKELCKFLEETITWTNFKESVKFIFVLIMTLGTASLYGLQYLGDFSIRLFREFNNLVKASTPIVIAILDVVSKTIGGFYILIAMMWRGQGNVPPQFPSIRPLPSQQKAINYPYQRKPYL